MRFLLAVPIIVGLTGIAHAEMRVSFEWGPTRKCFDANSPPFQISGVPEGTKHLEFRMRDSDAPKFNHGGGDVTYEGQDELPYGAFRYKGPCPPYGTHTYVFTVKAVDAKNQVLATARAERTFPQ